MKFPYKHIAFDLETTDLSPVYGEIVQIGAVVLNEDLSMGETFSMYVRPVTKHRNPKAMEVNGITEEQLAGAQTLDVVLPAFEAFALQAGERPVLAAWAAYFDVNFLRAQYEKMSPLRPWPFSYKSLDLKAIAQWEAARRDMDLPHAGVSGFVQALGLEFEGKAHDGLDDIRNSVRILQEFAKRV